MQTTRCDDAALAREPAQVFRAFLHIVARLAQTRRKARVSPHLREVA